MIRRFVTSLVLLVVGGLLALDLVATSVVNHDLASRAKTSTGATAASASLAPFPVLYHVLAQGEVPRVNVRLSGVPVGRLRIHTVSLALSKVDVSRRRLVLNRRVAISSIGRAAITAEVTSADLSHAIGQPVRVASNGEIDVTVAGVVVPVSPRLEGDSRLVVDVAGFSVLDVNLAAIPLLSDCRFGLHASPGELHLSCTMQPVPASVVNALSHSAG